MNVVPTEAIQIPEAERDRGMSSFAVSARLAHLLEFKNVRRLGDLHGLKIHELAGCRNFGRCTLAELHRLVSSVRGEFGNPLVVPVEAREISPHDLPISPHLARRLTVRKVARMRDLLGLVPINLFGLHYYRRGTFHELKGLLERLAAGEFQPSREPYAADQAPELLSLIDASIVKLPRRWRKVMGMLLGSGQTGPMLPDEIGQHLKLSKQRISQIQTLSLAKIRKHGGPILKSYLRGVADICEESVCPLTPALLTNWLGESAGQLKWTPVAYVWLLGKLDSAIPAWPHEQKPYYFRKWDARTTKALASILGEGKPALPLAEAFQLLCARLGKDRPTVGLFLKELKHSASLAVDFAPDGQGTVRRRVHE